MGCCASSSPGAPRATEQVVGDPQEKDAQREAQERVLTECATQLGSDENHEELESQPVTQFNSARSSDGDNQSTGAISVSRSFNVMKVLSNKSGLPSPRPMRPSLASQLQFSDRDQTIIIFDWDDTLCPSTWLRRCLQSDPHQKLQDVYIDRETDVSLSKLVDQVSLILNLAVCLGQVVIVTNAVRPWVYTSCCLFLPAAQQFVKGIPVIYALELLEARGRPRGKKEKDEWLTETKVRAMKAACSKFYSRYNNQSWKNVISVGDAFFEHNAIRQVVADRPEYTSTKKCRTKTVKLIQSPSIGGLSAQLALIASWLVKIVEKDSDVDIDLSATLEQISEWVKCFKSDSKGVHTGQPKVGSTAAASRGP